MGQYFKVVNLDKKEFLHPHMFNDGLKLMEFGRSSDGTMTGLAVLLATSNGRGNGDCRTDSTEVPGRWAGDRIAFVGDYSDDPWVYPHGEGEDDYIDISKMVRAVIEQDWESEKATSTTLQDLLRARAEVAEKIGDAGAVGVWAVAADLAADQGI